MKKIRKIIAGSLVALIFTVNFKANCQGEINTDKINSSIQDINKNKNNYNYNKQENLSKSKFDNIVNFTKKNKGKIIGSFSALAAYGLMREGIYNGLFPNSSKALYYRNLSDKEIDFYDKKALEAELIPISFKTNFGILKGFAYFPKNVNNLDIKKIILICGGNASISSLSLYSAVCHDSKENNKNKIFLCFDYPTYGKSEGPVLSQKVMQQYADSILSYAEILRNKKYKNAEFSVYGHSLGGYPASYLSKYEQVKEVSLWSPVQWDSAVKGLTNLSGLGILSRYVAFGGAKFDSIENIKNSHENCKINLFSGSLKKDSPQESDFISLEISVLNLENKKNKEKTKDNLNDWEENIAKESWQKLAKENKNNLGARLTVSFAEKANHSSNAFDNSVWILSSIWNQAKENNENKNSK